MKKALVLLLTISCFYGFNTIQAESPKTKLSEEEITDTLMMITIGEGLAANLVDLFCNRNLTELVFNGKKYSSIQTLYKDEGSANTQTLIKDPYLKNSSDCDYNKEICNKKSELDGGNHIYEKAYSGKDGTIWFYSYSLVYNPSKSSIKDFEFDNTINPRTMFNINSNKTVFVSNLLSRRLFTQNQFCTLYKKSLKVRNMSTKMKNLKIEKQAEKEDPIELKEQKFDILSTKISYKTDETSSDNIEFAPPVIRTETSWIANSGELKGFGLKYQRTYQSCKTYDDTITLAGLTQKVECKKIIDKVSSQYMIDYKFTLAE